MLFWHKTFPAMLCVNDAKKKKKNPPLLPPSSFNGIKVPLLGFKTLKVPTPVEGPNTGSGQQIYSILGSTHGTSELCLLTRDNSSSNSMVYGPTFSGLLNVCESYGDSRSNQAPQVIPATPAPSIPLGLKQRFYPFGNKNPTMTCVGESEMDGAALGPSSSTLCPSVTKRPIQETLQEVEEEEDEGRKKKKKKKKEKRLKTEQEEESMEMVEVKVEPEAETQGEVTTAFPPEEGIVLEEKRKKKKKKKDREGEEMEQGAEPIAMVKVEEVTVKSEPTDILNDDVTEACVKKKKKKKKSKTDDD